MPMHFRMADTLCEAHLMACTQKEADIAEILLQALEVESEIYGASNEKRQGGNSLLTTAQSRHHQLESELRS